MQDSNIYTLDDTLKKINEAQLKYYLLPARNPPMKYTKLHDQVFDFWLSVWKPVLAELGYSDSLLHDDFIRQDVVSCICSKDKVVAAFVYSFFSLEPKAVNTFRYMKNNFTDTFFQKIRAMGIRKVMAAQYLAIHPDWRGKANPPVPLASVVIGLSNRVRDEFGMEAGIGPARKDHKVTELFYARGGDCIVPDFENHNVTCDIIANIRGRTYQHASPVLRRVEDMLWSNRVDVTTVKKENKNTEINRELIG